jgi:hypothetical protein
MDIKDYIKSRSFRGIIVGIGAAVIVLIIFQAGVFVGYRKASFAYRFGDNYYRTFNRRTPAPLGFPVGDKFFVSHGAAGQVMSISLPTFVVAGPDSVEKTVLVGTSTLVRKLDAELKPEDIKTGDFVVVIGDPNDDSQIQAKLIRILPDPPSGGMRVIIQHP